MKKAICLILSLVLLFSLTSCALVARFKGDMSKLEHGEEGNLLYQQNSYYRADDRFEVRTTADDAVAELGWESQFPFFPDMHYYAFAEDAPTFIFCENGKSTLYSKGLYVKSDYDLYNAVYTVDDTDIEISLGSAMTKSEVEVSATGQGNASFRMYLKDDPRIQIYILGPYEYDGNWYGIQNGAWLLSDDFVALLKTNGVINE